MSRTVIQVIAGLIPMLVSDDNGVVQRATIAFSAISRELLPSGAGFDAGTTIDLDVSRHDRVVFATSFHHMNDNGYYDGWTEHKVIVTPTFDGCAVRVTGKNRNDIKDYIADMFHDALNLRINEYFYEGDYAYAPVF